MLHSNPRTLVVVYRPPPSRTNGLTSELFKFETFLEHLAAHKDQVMVVGDLVDDQNNTSAVKFLQVTETFDYVQNIKRSTHKDNNILDLIISRTDTHAASTLSTRPCFM